MANVKVNTISKVSGNNVAMQNSLTSAAGDIIYNSDDNKAQFYNGSAWSDL